MAAEFLNAITQVIKMLPFPLKGKQNKENNGTGPFTPNCPKHLYCRGHTDDRNKKKLRKDSRIPTA